MEHIQMIIDQVSDASVNVTLTFQRLGRVLLMGCIANSQLNSAMQLANLFDFDLEEVEAILVVSCEIAVLTD